MNKPEIQLADAKKLKSIMLAVQREVTRAMSLHVPFANEHEGYAVVLEELDELWDEIKVRQTDRDHDKIRKEATQLAAMAVRFLYDLGREP